MRHCLKTIEKNKFDENSILVLFLVFSLFMARLKKNRETEPVNAFRFSLSGLLLVGLLSSSELAAIRLFAAKSKLFSLVNNAVPAPGALAMNIITLITSKTA